MEAFDAINLNSFDYRDSSIIVVTFSREHGRLSLLAKGIKQSPRASRGLLQSFCHNHYIIGRKTNLSIISSMDSLDTFSELSSDLDRVTWGYECLQLIQAVVQEGQSHPALFDLCLSTLRTFSREAKNRLFDAMTHFKTELLRLEGLLPDDDNRDYNINSLIERYLSPKPVILKP